MPFRVKVIPELEIVYVQNYGRITFEEIVASYQDFLIHPESSKVKYILNDIRDLASLAMVKDVLNLVVERLASDFQSEATPRKMAMLSDMNFWTEASLHAAKFPEGMCKPFLDPYKAANWFGLSWDDLEVKISDEDD